MPWDTIKKGNFQDNTGNESGGDWVVAAVTGEGGHVGWFYENSEGGQRKMKRWYVDPIVEFLRGVYEVRFLLQHLMFPSAHK